MAIIQESAIQKLVNELLEQADLYMDQIIEEEAEHGKCYNFITTESKCIWYFEDGYKMYFDRA